MIRISIPPKGSKKKKDFIMFLIYCIFSHVVAGIIVHAKNFRDVHYQMEIKITVISANLYLIMIQTIMNQMHKIQNSKKIADIYLSMKKDLKECINFDPSIDNFWNYDFKFNWQDYEENQHYCYLKK